MPNAASIEGGIVIDLGHFSEVTPFEDGSSVVIGSGSKWMGVSKVLDEIGLAVVGGRNSVVGVGGLTLGGKHMFLSTLKFNFILIVSSCLQNLKLYHDIIGTVINTDTLLAGISFFSPRFGFVCSNIIEYEIVLASDKVTTASESTNPDLWRALKGGCNSFGIVTRFTARSFHPLKYEVVSFTCLPFKHPKSLQLSTNS